MVERPFEEEEVCKVICGMASDNKAPGLENFTIGFFQAFWKVIMGDFIRVFQGFFIVMPALKKVSMLLFLALNLKKVGFVDVRYYRPISLVNVGIQDTF